MYSTTTGIDSTMWPSASTTGWSRRVRIEEASSPTGSPRRSLTVRRRFQMIDSSTGARGEGTKSPPVVWATGNSAVWYHVFGMPRMAAMVSWSDW